MSDFPRLAGGTAAQVFVLQRGNTMLTSTAGPKSGVHMIHCVASGDLTIDYQDDGDPESVSFTEGDEFGFEQPVKITIAVGGTFHLMV